MAKRPVSVNPNEAHAQVDNFVEDSRTCEYAVSQKIEGKWRLAKIALIIGYVLVIGGYFTVCCIYLWPLACFTPLLAWIIWFFTWKHVSVSYRYRIISGEMIFVKGYRNKFGDEMFRIKIKDADVIAPYESVVPGSEGFAPPKSKDEAVRTINYYAPEKTLWAASSFSSPDLYYMLFTDENGVKKVLYFEVTGKALKLLKYYNPNTIVTQVRF